MDWLKCPHGVHHPLPSPVGPQQQIEDRCDYCNIETVARVKKVHEDRMNEIKGKTKTVYMCSEGWNADIANDFPDTLYPTRASIEKECECLGKGKHDCKIVKLIITEISRIVNEKT